MEDILENKWGFRKLRKATSQKDEVDVDQFTHIRRIHIIHYLFYSPIHKSFSIGIRYEKPKGEPGRGGGTKEWNIIMIPKIINNIEDAETLLNGILN